MRVAIKPNEELMPELQMQLITPCGFDTSYALCVAIRCRVN